MGLERIRHDWVTELNWEMEYFLPYQCRRMSQSSEIAALCCELLSPQEREEYLLSGNHQAAAVPTPTVNPEKGDIGCEKHRIPAPLAEMHIKGMTLVSPDSCIVPYMLWGCHVWLFVNPWTVARQTSLSMGFSRWEYWSRLLFPSPGELPDPGIQPVSPASPPLTDGFFTTELPEKPFPYIVKFVQLYLTLCDPMDYIVHGILQARILEWVALPFSRGSSQFRNWTRVFCIAGGLFINWAIREAIPIHRKVLNSLTWGIWFSLIINNLLMFRLAALCHKTSVQPGSSSHLLRAVLSGLLEMLPPRLEVLKNSHRIKHNSQLLGCEYFFKTMGFILRTSF